VQVLPYSEETVETIAFALDAKLARAPFQLPGAAVYQITLEDPDGRASAMLTLWPSLRRVDAVGTGAVIVFTRIVSLQIVDRVEALFRRESGDYLIVTTAGRIIVKS
jgi:hypothetical protein